MSDSEFRISFSICGYGIFRGITIASLAALALRRLESIARGGAAEALAEWSQQDPVQLS
jgi:hypothetical protein